MGSGHGSRRGGSAAPASPDSLAYALSHRQEAVEYAEQVGRGLDREKTDKFVGLYVNDLTLGYRERGRKAVELLRTEAFAKGLIPKGRARRVRDLNLSRS